METYDRYDLQDEFGDDLDDIASEIRFLRDQVRELRVSLDKALAVR